MYKIIAIVGMPGTGKSLLCEHYIKKNYQRVYFGGIILEEVKRQGFPIEQQYEKKVREELREKHGMGAVAKLALPKIETFLKNNDKVIIDGLYSMSEYNILKEKFGSEILIIAVYTNRNIRYKRLSEREIRPLTEDQAENRDIQEIMFIEKGGPIAMADYMFINNDTPEALIKQAEDLDRKLSL